MHSLFRNLLLVALVGQVVTAPGPRKRYKIKPSENYTLVWEILDDDHIRFAALVKTLGWVGLGLNTKPKMDGADLIIAGIGENERPYLHSYHAIGHHLVPEETTQWEIGYGKFFEDKNSSITIVNVVRPLDAENNDGIHIQDRDMYILWAYGEDDNIGKKHVEHGAVRVNLINPSVDNTF